MRIAVQDRERDKLKSELADLRIQLQELQRFKPRMPVKMSKTLLKLWHQGSLLSELSKLWEWVFSQEKFGNGFTHTGPKERPSQLPIARLQIPLHRGEIRESRMRSVNFLDEVKYVT